MTKRHYFCIIDSETTMDDTVLDFAAVISDRKGNIYHKIAVLVKDSLDSFPFHNSTKEWSLASQKEKYARLMNNGSRLIASVSAINRWLDKAADKYSPMLTAYNLQFDVSKCHNTAIDLSMFPNRFCLWYAAVSNFAMTKKYRQFILDNHLFNKPTEKGNMTYRTDAEAMAAFILNEYRIEPHTALEDIIEFELPILKKLLTKKKWQDKIVSYDWKKMQVKDGYKAI